MMFNYVKNFLSRLRTLLLFVLALVPIAEVMANRSKPATAEAAEASDITMAGTAVRMVIMSLDCGGIGRAWDDAAGRDRR